MRLLAVVVFGSVLLACSGGSEAPSDRITRIDGPAVVDMDSDGELDG